MRECRVRDQKSFDTFPSGGWHRCPLMSICGKRMKAPFALLHLTHIYTHACLLSILSTLWVSHYFNIRSTLYFPRMATTLSPISQGSPGAWAFLHQDIESTSLPLDYLSQQRVAEVTLGLPGLDHKNVMLFYLVILGHFLLETQEQSPSS